MSSQIRSSPWRLIWDSSLSVGIPEIDVEHEYAIYLVNSLNDAIVSHASEDEIFKYLRLILADTSSHFDHEETLLRQWCYPQLPDHAAKHAQIMRVLNETIDQFGRGYTEQELTECGLSIKGLLIEHLLTEDMKYVDYCAGHQPR